MNYYFPSILSSLYFTNKELPVGFLPVNSGENAIRLLLRSYGLKPDSKIAIPVYVCDSLKQAVLKEGFEPIYLDLKADGSFWSDYNAELISKERPAVVILVHLYGFLHPDTISVMDFCKTHSILLIHDAAQSYGIDERAFIYSSGLVYSFGPGKSSTAACGALVKGLNDAFYASNCGKASFLQDLQTRLFLKSRMYGYRFSLIDKLMQRVINRFPAQDAIAKMTNFQLAAAAVAMKLVVEKAEERKARYNILRNAVMSGDLLRLPFEDEKGLCFKAILNVNRDPLKFKTYLRDNKVPFFSLAETLVIGREKHKQYPVFSKNAGGFIELSTEASLPIEEVVRVAEILKKYS